MIRVITFDADGTLWDFERVMREALALAEYRLGIVSHGNGAPDRRGRPRLYLQRRSASA